jgi:hypothetical protein
MATEPKPGPSAHRCTDEVRSAMARLEELIQGLCVTAERQFRRRCPYCGVGSVCHYRGACRHQLRAGGHEPVRCRGIADRARVCDEP